MFLHFYTIFHQAILPLPMSLFIHGASTCGVCGAWFIDDDGFQSRLNMHMALKHRGGSRKRYREADSDVAVAESASSGGEFDLDRVGLNSNAEDVGDESYGVAVEDQSDLEHLTTFSSNSEPSEADELDSESIDMFSGRIAAI